MFFRKRKEPSGEASARAIKAKLPDRQPDAVSPKSLDFNVPRNTVDTSGSDGHGQWQSPQPSKLLSPLDGLRGLRILLAEDHKTNALLQIEELEHFGATVEHALDGEIACQLMMSGDKFDIILMDLLMPRMDGFEAARRIRAWEEVEGRRPSLIIASTGLAEEFEHRHTSDAGMDAYLLKPFSTEQLAAVIQSLLSAKCVAREVAA